VKRWWLVLALLLSLGVNLGILAVLVLHRLRPPPPPPEMLPAPVLEAGVERLADRLGLTGDPRQRFVELQRGFFETTRRERQRMVELHQELRAELTSGDPDRQRVEAILGELGQGYSAVEGALARLILDSREVLDPRQQRQYLIFLSRLRGAGLERARPGMPLRRPFRRRLGRPRGPGAEPAAP
jgi:Spy/CpxP family protein refolding chaperone